MLIQSYNLSFSKESHYQVNFSADLNCEQQINLEG